MSSRGPNGFRRFLWLATLVVGGLSRGIQRWLVSSDNWRAEVSVPAEIRIFEALADPTWDWRTIEALAQVSGLTIDAVRGVFSKYPHLVQLGRSSDGQELYTLKARYWARQKPWKMGWKIITGSSSSTT